MIKNFKLNQGSLLSLGKQLTDLVLAGKEFTVTVSEYSKRKLSANAVQHVWYKVISEHTGEDLKTVECRCKRDFGLPILLAGDNGPVNSWMLDRMHFGELSDSQQLKVIGAMAITSTFTTKQHNQYRDNIQSFWNHNGLFLDYEK